MGNLIGSFETAKIEVVRTKQRDIDSTSLEILYDGNEIGYGHLNNRTNFAHVTLNEYDQDLEDFLVTGIEERTINLT